LPLKGLDEVGFEIQFSQKRLVEELAKAGLASNIAKVGLASYK
jgi:hypothetical protein